MNDLNNYSSDWSEMPRERVMVDTYLNSLYAIFLVWSVNRLHGLLMNAYGNWMCMTLNTEIKMWYRWWHFIHARIARAWPKPLAKMDSGWRKPTTIENQLKLPHRTWISKETHLSRSIRAHEQATEIIKVQADRTNARVRARIHIRSLEQIFESRSRSGTSDWTTGGRVPRNSMCEKGKKNQSALMPRIRTIFINIFKAYLTTP